MFAIRITAGASTAIYQQIVTQVRHGIATGALVEGEWLPSVRGLAEELLINPNTVAKAYGELSKDGLVEAVPGKGLAVARRGAGMGVEERARRMGEVVEGMVREAVGVGMGRDELLGMVECVWLEMTGGTKPRRHEDTKAHEERGAIREFPQEEKGSTIL